MEERGDFVSPFIMTKMKKCQKTVDSFRRYVTNTYRHKQEESKKCSYCP